MCHNLQRILGAAVIFLSASPAFADAIDGDWCSSLEASQLRIEGPAIVTPGGSRTSGDYSRHAFAYVAPDGDPDAGDEVAMQLLNDDELELSVNGGPLQLWRRCELTS